MHSSGQFSAVNAHECQLGRTALDISNNLFLGRELRKPGLLGSVLRAMVKRPMREHANQFLQVVRVVAIRGVADRINSAS